MNNLAQKRKELDHATYFTKAAVQLFDGRVADIYQDHIIGLEEFDRIVATFKKTHVDIQPLSEISESIQYYQTYVMSLFQNPHHWQNEFTAQFDRFCQNSPTSTCANLY